MLRTTASTDRTTATDNSKANSITYLLRQLRDGTALMLRQEIALAKAELARSAKKVARGGAIASAGGALAYTGAIFLLAALTIGLAVGLSALDVPVAHAAWISPLIVGAIVATVGLYMIQRGKTMISETDLSPERTIETVRENKQWIQQKVN